MITAGKKKKEVSEFDTKNGEKRGIFSYYVEEVLKEEENELLSPQQIVEKLTKKIKESNQIDEDDKIDNIPTYSSLNTTKYIDLIGTPFISINREKFLTQKFSKKEIFEFEKKAEKEKIEFQQSDTNPVKDDISENLKKQLIEHYKSLKISSIDQQKDFDLSNFFVDVLIKKFHDEQEKKRYLENTQKMSLNSFYYSEIYNEEKGEILKMEQLFEKNKIAKLNSNSSDNVILIEGKAGVGK